MVTYDVITSNNQKSLFLKLGEHFICELSGCNVALLENTERVKELFGRAVRSSQLSVVGEGGFEFSPHGYTGYFLLAESHASIHTWPEHGYCAIDLFTCNLHLDTARFFSTLKNFFEGEQVLVQKIERGIKYVN
jgi:S-adenosylmethionine decarboxylase